MSDNDFSRDGDSPDALSRVPPPSFPRKCDNGDVRYSRLNASRPARPSGGGSLDAATANAAAASHDAII